VAAAEAARAEGAAWRRTARRVLANDQTMFALVMLGSLLAWQLAVVGLGVESYVLPTPLEVADNMVSEWRGLLTHSWASAKTMILGFVMAAFSGIFLAAAMSYYRVLEQTLSPLIVTFQTIPKVALAPLFVVWFGYSMAPRVLVATTIAFFPIIIDTMVGLRATKRSSIDAVRVMGASRRQIFWKVQFRSALPNVFGGLKVATTLVVIGTVVGEYIVSNEGLGYLQLQATSNFDSPMLFSALVLMAVLGLIAYELVSWLERLTVPWARHATGSR
jgi:NitT/TauT family transport system permease protein